MCANGKGGCAGPEQEAVWVLFTKHVTRTQLTNEDFVTLHVYRDTQGRRVRYPENALHWGTYINSVVRGGEETLLRGPETCPTDRRRGGEPA
jgi:hypothetical protein